MPAVKTPRTPKPRDMRLRRRPKVPLTEEEEAKLKSLAKEAGMTQAKYMRQALLSAMGQAAPPKKKRARSDDLLHAVSDNTFQLKGLGRNFNQLVKRAHEGAIPITRGEIQYFENQFQMALAQNSTAVEAILA